MKFKSIFTFLFILLVTVSCKKEDKDAASEKQATPPPFTIIITMTAKEDDIMSLYYKDNSVPNFIEEMSVYKEVKKGNQEIVINLPEGVLPNDVRFDLSTRTQTQVCKIEKIHLENQGKSFDFVNQDLEKFLIPNPLVVFDAKDRSYSFKEVDGNYDPFLNVTDEFRSLMIPLITQSQPAK